MNNTPDDPTDRTVDADFAVAPDGTTEARHTPEKADTRPAPDAATTPPAGTPESDADQTTPNAASDAYGPSARPNGDARNDAAGGSGAGEGLAGEEPDAVIGDARSGRPSYDLGEDSAGDGEQTSPVADDGEEGGTGADTDTGTDADTAIGAMEEQTSQAGKKPPKQGFFASHPPLRVPEPFAPSLCSRLFNLLAWSPIVVLTALLAAQVMFSLDARALWYSDEIRHADAFRNFLAGGNWFVLEMNGTLYPDKPPLYFWFLRGLYEIVKIEGPFLYFLGTAVSGLLYLWSFLLLGRLAARFDGRSLLAGGIMLLCGFYVMGLMHYSRMDLLFSALIVCSYTAFYHAWINRVSLPAMLLGFLFAALAVLTKGLLGLALPLAAGVLFLIWRGTPLRLLRWDTLLGLIVGAMVVGAWVGGASLHLGDPEAFLDVYVKEQTLGRVFNAFHHRADWWYYLIGVPLLFLPWTTLFFALPWHGLFGKKMREGLVASRRPEGEGYAYLWCIVLSALPVLSLVSGKIVIYFLPALPALALLAGRAVLQLSARRAALFRHVTAVFLLAAGLAFAAASLMLFGLLPLPAIKGVPAWQMDFNPLFLLTAAGLIFTAFLLWLLLRSSKPEGVLLVLALSFTALSFPLATLIAPAFDQFLSPKAQAEVMKGLIKEGYAPVSYRDYGGTYSYYAEHVIAETRDLQKVAEAAGKGKIALAMRLSDWEKWEGKPAGCVKQHEQWLETRRQILLACDPTPADAPETAPAVPEPPADASVAPTDASESPTDAPATPTVTPTTLTDTPESPTDASATTKQAAPASPEAASPQDTPSEPIPMHPQEQTPAQKITPEPASEHPPASGQTPAQPQGRTPAPEPAPEEPSAPEHMPEQIPEQIPEPLPGDIAGQ